ncbi:10404_t:CDS:2 [Cetraspora pellucida]|uniref:10404_t:CDS:1 n=1 Tax=Cetraspora pellucida TaxID=1433469 RepID=A0ACA9K0T1_9GLOM|nr:10404_t:CDS:2 [Cetraspora pellucida]
MYNGSPVEIFYAIRRNTNLSRAHNLGAPATVGSSSPTLTNDGSVTRVDGAPVTLIGGDAIATSTGGALTTATLVNNAPDALVGPSFNFPIALTSQSFSFPVTLAHNTSVGGAPTTSIGGASTVAMQLRNTNVSDGNGVAGKTEMAHNIGTVNMAMAKTDAAGENRFTAFHDHNMIPLPFQMAASSDVVNSSLQQNYQHASSSYPPPIETDVQYNNSHSTYTSGVYNSMPQINHSSGEHNFNGSKLESTEIQVTWNDINKIYPRSQ